MNKEDEEKLVKLIEEYGRLHHGLVVADVYNKYRKITEYTYLKLQTLQQIVGLVNGLLAADKVWPDGLDAWEDNGGRPDIEGKQLGS